jgi:recombination protein RecR
VVEDVADVWALERNQLFRGRYHVLGGTLSAIEGRGPENLRITQLLERATHSEIQEVILATSATVDGQTTAHYLTNLLKQNPIKITRLAQGLPFGGEIDYLDEGTLSTALASRMAM